MKKYLRTFAGISSMLLFSASVPASDYSAVFSIEGSDPIFLENVCSISSGQSYITVNGLHQLFDTPLYTDGASIVSDINQNKYHLTFEDGSCFSLSTSLRSSISDTTVSEILLLLDKAWSFQYPSKYQDVAGIMRQEEGYTYAGPSFSINDFQALSYYIEDFDNDQHMELLVALPSSDDFSTLILHMYEVVNNQVSLAAELKTDAGILPTELGYTYLYVFENNAFGTMIGYDSYSNACHYADGVFTEFQHYHYNGSTFITTNSWSTAGSDFTGDPIEQKLLSFGLKNINVDAFLSGHQSVKDYLPKSSHPHTFFSLTQDFTLSDDDFWNFLSTAVPGSTIHTGIRFFEQDVYIPDIELTSQYILPDSHVRIYSEFELSDLSAQELWIAKNEIFARHGRMFNNSFLAEYFNSKSWYEGTIPPESFQHSTLSAIETQNISLLERLEQAKKN